MGILEAFGACFTYFIVLSDFGFSFSELFGLTIKQGYRYNSGDQYNPKDPYFGNSMLKGGCDAAANQDLLGKVGNQYTPDWIFNDDLSTDLRMVFVECQRDSNGTITGALSSTFQWGDCKIAEVSPITNLLSCYTVEAVKYAQTAYFCSIVVLQWGNCISNKTTRTSLLRHGFKNYRLICGLAFEAAICICLVYIPVMWNIMGTRPLTLMHLGVPALPFTLLILVYGEVRKLVINSTTKRVTRVWESLMFVITLCFLQWVARLILSNSTTLNNSL